MIKRYTEVQAPVDIAELMGAKKGGAEESDGKARAIIFGVNSK